MSSPILKRFSSLKMLYSWVLVCGYSSPESGFGLSMSRGHRVGHHLAVGPMLRPLRDGIRQVLADHPLEALAVLRAIEMSQHVVE